MLNIVVDFLLKINLKVEKYINYKINSVDMIQLDQKDKQFLYYLEKNSRESLSSIGRKIRVSKELLKYRLQRLEKEGIIKRFETIINQFAMGFEQYRILCTVQDPDRFIKQIQKNFDVLIRRRRLSKWNIDVAVWAKTNAEFEKQMQEIISTQAEIQNISIMVITKRFSLLHAIIHNKQEYTELQKLKNDVDEKSSQLLSYVKNDARIQAIDLAKKLDISAVAVAKKLKKLQKDSIIIGTRVVINTKILNYSQFQIHFSCVNKTDVSQIQYALLESKYVTGLRRLIGEFDLEVVVECQNSFELAEFVEKIQSQFLIKKFDVALL